MRAVAFRRIGLALARSQWRELSTVSRLTEVAAQSEETIMELDLSQSEDLVCNNIICEKVGDPCICRLSRILERKSLSQLHTVRLVGNRLSVLPASLWALPRLRVVDARDNLLTAVPEGAAGVPGLETLDLRGNPRIASAGVPEELKRRLGPALIL